MAENEEFYVEEEYLDTNNSSSFGKLLELSWDSPKYLTNLKGLFQLLESKYISNCDFPPNPAKLQQLGCLQADMNKTLDCENGEICTIDVPANLNFSFFLLKSMDDIKGSIISIDLIKRVLPVLCLSDNAATISHFISTLFNQDRLQFHPELLQRFKGLQPLERDCISRAFCDAILPKHLKNRDFYNFLLTNTFIFDVIDFSTGREFWSHVPIEVVDRNRDSLVHTLNLSNIEFYSYLPKFYQLLEEGSSAECNQLLTLIKNKDFNIFLLLIFNLFINKIDMLR